MVVVYDDEEAAKENAGNVLSTMWIVVAVSAFAALLVFLVFVLRILWRRIQHQKIRKDAPQKPLSLHRRPTPAVKSPATGATGSSTHYLKKSPSPTALTPSSGGNSPTSVSSNAAGSKSPRESPTSEETSGPSMAEESTYRTESELPIHQSHAAGSTCEAITTSREILTGTLGQLFFSVKYKNEKPTLAVTIVKCQNLPGKDAAHSSPDPYVKLQLLPEKQHKVKTRVMKNTRNPVYEEDFAFYGIKADQLESLTLHFIVLLFDRYSRDEIIGEVFFPLNSVVDLTNRENTTYQKDILPRNLRVKSQGRGEILVSLCWQPAANRLTTVILKARNLPKMDVTGLADPYVKIYLTYKGQRIAKKKTHMKKRTLNPVFNESFVFDIPSGADEINNISLEILLLDWDRVTRNEVIGRIDVGAKAVCDSAQRHWSEVRKAPRRQIADWHKLCE